MKKRLFSLLASLSVLFAVCFSGAACGKEPTCEEHMFGDWTVYRQATCATEGLEMRSCLNCNTKETQPIAKLTTHNTVHGKCSYCSIITNPYEAFVYYVTQNGNYDYSDNKYSLMLGMTTMDDGTVYSRHANYDATDAELNIAILWDNDYYLTVEINKYGSSYGYVLLVSDYYMIGTLNPSTLSSATTSLYYTTTNITYANLKTSASKMGASMANLLAVHLTTDIAASGVTAKDLGFKNY